MKRKQQQPKNSLAVLYQAVAPPPPPPPPLTPFTSRPRFCPATAGVGAGVAGVDGVDGVWGAERRAAAALFLRATSSDPRDNACSIARMSGEDMTHNSPAPCCFNCSQ